MPAASFKTGSHDWRIASRRMQGGGFPSCLLLLLCIFSSLPSPALGAFKSSKDAGSKESAYNPRPAPDDIILPMPCGLQMVLRTVAVPVSSALGDKTFRMGVVNAADEGRNFYERRFDGRISAPFTGADLPEKWRAAIGETDLAGDRYYFIGKYEVSRLQWQAVQDAVNGEGAEDSALCPKPDAQGANLPQGGVSWFGAQEFLKKYNAWLVKNHADALPRFADSANLGYLRLPTEEEWEYAARGGPLVPAEWWEDRDVFPLAEGRELKDYGVFDAGSPQNGPAPIGSRNPNPLGLYDVMGNVRELADGFFRLSIADWKGGAAERRLHGSAGGILSKGGSHLSGESAVIPGARDELPLFTVNGEMQPSDMGMRVVLSSLNIPDARKLAELRSQEGAGTPAAEDPLTTAGVKDDPLEALRLMASRAEGTLKSSLEAAAANLEDQRDAEKARHLKSIDYSLHSLLYQAETLRAFAFRYISANKQIASIEELAKKPLNAEDRKKVEAALKEAKSDLADYLESLKMSANYYRQGLSALLEADGAEVARLVAQAKREYGGAGIFNEHIRQNLAELEKFLARARKEGLGAVSSKTILKNTIPAQHLKQLPL